MEGRHMKLRMILGLLLAGSLFVGTAVQTQDLTRDYLDALDDANAALETARTARERQQAEKNVQEVEAAMQGVRPQIVIPGIGNIWVVSVECNGECSDSTLAQICARIGSGFLPFAVDCGNVDNDSGSACGGDNRCLARPISTTDPLGDYCDDGGGWDAQVYCVRP
jgi:hypothetical protein